MSSSNRKTPKFTTLYDPHQPGRSRTVPESEAKAWKDAGWTETTAPEPKATETKAS